MRFLVGLLTLFWLSATFAQKKRTGQVIEKKVQWTRNIRGLNVKESAVVTRQFKGLLLRTVDANMARVNMSRSSIMFDLSKNIAAVYLHPKTQGNKQAGGGPCFIVSVVRDYNLTADMIIARNRTYISNTATPLEFHASASSMDFAQRQSFRSLSPLIDGFCYYSHIIDCTLSRTNTIGGSRILVQGIDRPIILHLDKSTNFDVGAFY
ncbi:uncharacterized protein LOC121368618 [Gigantopelta aegis]|uniref:uncharacterized protein LOC121368618 n=1 Tax=Gigantopelta aegis TaxID=1735272 RepID=UPI001B88CA72|nr:uncharacterized protein LOC121368618 [Gigantopelta aegis]